MGKVFISYSREDSDTVDRFIAELAKSGITCWYDREYIEGGEVWTAAISRAIVECEALCVLLSPHCVASAYVVKEVLLAQEHKRPILPVMLKTCEIPAELDFQLVGLERIDFTIYSFDQGVQRTGRALQKLLKLPLNSTSAAAAATSGPPPMPPPASLNNPPQFNPPPTFVPQPNPALAVAQVLCGRWQFQNLTNGSIGVVDWFPQGGYNGQGNSQMGPFFVNGQWWTLPDGSVMLRGQIVVMGVRNVYMRMVRFTQVGPGSLAGVADDGEQTLWTRIG